MRAAIRMTMIYNAVFTTTNGPVKTAVIYDDEGLRIWIPGCDETICISKGEVLEITVDINSRVPVAVEYSARRYCNKSDNYFYVGPI